MGADYNETSRLGQQRNKTMFIPTAVYPPLSPVLGKPQKVFKEKGAVKSGLLKGIERTFSPKSFFNSLKQGKRPL